MANPLGALLHGRPAARQWRCVTAPCVRSQLTRDILGLTMWCVYLRMQIPYETIQQDSQYHPRDFRRPGLRFR